MPPAANPLSPETPPFFPSPRDLGVAFAIRRGTSPSLRSGRRLGGRRHSLNPADCWRTRGFRSLRAEGMEDHIAYLKEVLRRYFDPATPPEQREELEGALTQFKLRPDGWKLAVYALQRESRGAGEGPYLIWFSASVLEETVRRSWPTIPEQVLLLGHLPPLRGSQTPRLHPPPLDRFRLQAPPPRPSRPWSSGTSLLRLLSYWREATRHGHESPPLLRTLCPLAQCSLPSPLLPTA